MVRQRHKVAPRPNRRGVLRFAVVGIPPPAGPQAVGQRFHGDCPALQSLCQRLERVALEVIQFRPGRGSAPRPLPSCSSGKSIARKGRGARLTAGAALSLYDTARWKRIRRQVFTRDKGQCRMCGVILTSGRASDRAAVADHIEPHRGQVALFFDQSNVWAICKQCHDGPCKLIERDGQGDIAARKLAWRPEAYDSEGRPTDPLHPWNA